jgi:hypothetical protein
MVPFCIGTFSTEMMPLICGSILKAMQKRVIIFSVAWPIIYIIGIPLLGLTRELDMFLFGYAVGLLYIALTDYKPTRIERLKRNGGSHTQIEWIALCIRHNHTCACCGQRKHLTKDHIKSVSRGGNNSITNIQPLCLDCNRSKATKLIDYRPIWHRTIWQILGWY